jgi:hypothetical protein
LNQEFLEGGSMFFKEEFSKRTIIQLRWALMISIGYIFVFGHAVDSIRVLFYLLFPLYASTNLLLSFTPQRWFQEQRFISLILLLDLTITALTLFWAGPEDSAFYISFFLILLISATTRKVLLVYSTFGLILAAYGVTSYIKSPQTFFETTSLLQFPFIFIIGLFFRGIVESYNRVYQEKELLKEDYRELEVLNSLALSIGEDRDLSGFLLKLSKLLSEKLVHCRCTAIFMDSNEDYCYMLSSDDSPEKECFIIDVKKFPTLKESLKSDEIFEEKEKDSPLPIGATSKYILKKIPISFKKKTLGTLYLRANTLKRSLTHREEYFLQILGRITAIAILDVERSLMLEKIFGKEVDWPQYQDEPENSLYHPFKPHS